MDDINTAKKATRIVAKAGDAVERAAEAILCDEAFWIAARTGQYALKSILWVDRVRELGTSTKGTAAETAEPAAARTI